VLWAFGAVAVWALNLLILRCGLGQPLRLGRAPVLAAGFAFLMTLFGSGSYWATTLLYPWYRVGITRAAFLVAVCTAVALAAAAAVVRLRRREHQQSRPALEWRWSRLRVVTYLVFVVAAVGTAVTIHRIGYVPILTGDPTAARVQFPAIGGVWYRVSMIGGVVAMLVAVQAAARRATPVLYAIGAASLVLVGVYGARFFVALPLGVAVLLWDRVRSPLPLWRIALVLVLSAPVLGAVGYWRSRDATIRRLPPIGLLFYGTFGEFRDLAWAVDNYGDCASFLHGRTLGSAVVPLLPTPVWRVVGVDKVAVYDRNSATFVADAMGESTGQRIGAYGEFYMNFGWVGAIVGAVLYGLLLGALDQRDRQTAPEAVPGIFLALVLATTVFAQIGQLNMFTSTLTGYGYPIVLAALLAARRRGTEGAPASA